MILLSLIFSIGAVAQLAVKAEKAHEVILYTWLAGLPFQTADGTLADPPAPTLGGLVLVIAAAACDSTGPKRKLAELPLVILNIQRAGPSTGMPTNIEQSDLNIACFGGHGDSPRVVIAPADVDVVDEVRGRLAVAQQHALDRDLGVARPLASRASQAVVEQQFDAGAVHRLALARAVEQDILHGVPAQVARGGFPQHPAHGVDDVGLAAAVGADDAYQLSGDGDMSGVYERLEACQIDLFESQFQRSGVRL